MLARHLAFAILSAAMVIPVMASADPGRITGFGGIFFKSKDPKALAAWYRTIDPEWRRLKQAEKDHAANSPKPSVVKALISSEGVPAVRFLPDGDAGR